MLGPALAVALLAASVPAHPAASRPVPLVLVQGGDRFGAGVVWDAPAGLVLTALHVVEGLPDVQVSLDGAPPAPARVVDVDPALDLALVATSPLGPAAVKWPCAPAARGDPVRLLGFPRRRAAAVTGTILDPAHRFAGARYVEIAGRAEPGASGGPVVDASGAIVGVVDLVLADRDRTLAVPIDAAVARFPRSARGGTAAERDAPVARAGAAGATPVPHARAD